MNRRPAWQQPFLAGLTVLIVAGLAGAGESPSKPPFKVTVVGKGRPMILIPGLACSSAVWDSTVAHFKDKYQCHVLTFAGFAGQPPVAGPFLETMRKGIADYIRAKKLHKPVIVGHSLGGHLVFDLGENDPDLVGPLISVDGMPCLGAVFNEKIDAAGLKTLAEQTRVGMEKATRAQYLTQSKAMVRFWISDKKHQVQVEKCGADSDQKTVAKAMSELLGADLRPKLTSIKSPVLMLGAWSKDMATFGAARAVVTKHYKDQVAPIPHHTLAIAANSKHFIMYDAPDWMFKQMDAFLKGK
jgi:N-formylmaleamate deformylase